jgi:hypothetical protein
VHRDIEGLIRHQLLEAAILLLEGLEPFGLADLEAGILTTPAIRGGLGDVMLAAEPRDGDAGGRLVQDSDDLLGSESAGFMSPPASRQTRTSYLSDGSAHGERTNAEGPCQLTPRCRSWRKSHIEAVHVESYLTQNFSEALEMRHETAIA